MDLLGRVKFVDTEANVVPKELGARLFNWHGRAWLTNKRGSAVLGAFSLHG